MRSLAIPSICTEIVGVSNSDRTETENVLTALSEVASWKELLRSHLLIVFLTLSFFSSFLLCYVWGLFVPRTLSRVPASQQTRGFASIRNLVEHSLAKCHIPSHSKLFSAARVREFLFPAVVGLPLLREVLPCCHAHNSACVSAECRDLPSTLYVWPCDRDTNPTNFSNQV